VLRCEQYCHLAYGAISHEQQKESQIVADIPFWLSSGGNSNHIQVNAAIGASRCDVMSPTQPATL
jgi:hypothetical protein